MDRITVTMPYPLGGRVTVDGDDSIKGTVTGFCVRDGGRLQVEVSYFHNGESKACWVEDYRLREHSPGGS